MTWLSIQVVPPDTSINDFCCCSWTSCLSVSRRWGCPGVLTVSCLRSLCPQSTHVVVMKASFMQGHDRGRTQRPLGYTPAGAEWGESCRSPSQASEWHLDRIGTVLHQQTGLLSCLMRNDGLFAPVTCAASRFMSGFAAMAIPGGEGTTDRCGGSRRAGSVPTIRQAAQRRRCLRPPGPAPKVRRTDAADSNTV